MLMNWIESAFVNSPVRHALQACEARSLIALGGRTPGAVVVEIGCGNGYGTSLVLNRFGAARVDAVDLDPKMIERARRRLARQGDRVNLAQGSATDLRNVFALFGGGGDASYGAAFGFGVLHHIPSWRDALAEIARVLQPGGKYFFDEVTATALARPSYRLLFDHPRQDRFTAGELLAELPRHGLDVGERWRTYFGGDYLLGVAIRREASEG
ncbi:class I SAM-dependent methyltransferase [Saccharopolyspora shandongensis]|uniref:class I SAM-dependent methyltransferase n=1 Tax=Saccharopolyspora shandongensis TaxID=418495 RepID=UPI0033CE9BB4